MEYHIERFMVYLMKCQQGNKMELSWDLQLEIQMAPIKGENMITWLVVLVAK